MKAALHPTEPLSTDKKAAFGCIVIDGRAYRRITDAETQNILVANEDGRGGHKSFLTGAQSEQIRMRTSIDKNQTKLIIILFPYQ